MVIGVCCSEMKWNYHNWKETVVDKDKVCATVLKEREKVKKQIDPEAKAAPNY